MPIKITCTGCKKTLNIPGKFAGKTIKCPSCAMPITVPMPDGTPSPEDDLALQPLEGAAPAAAAPSAGPSQTPGFCPQCGKPVAPGAVICVNCGTNVVTGEQIPAAARPKKRGAGIPIALIVKSVAAVVLLVVAVTILKGVFGGKEEQGSDETGGSEPPPQTAQADDAKTTTNTQSDTAVTPAEKPDEPAKPDEPPKPKEPTVRERFDAAMAKVADPLEAQDGVREIRALGAEALPLIRENLKNEDPSIRAALAAGLGAIPIAEVGKDLSDLVLDEAAPVRRAATAALRRYRAGNIDTCLALLKSEEALAREAGIVAISINKSASEVRIAINGATDDSDAGVRYAAISALAGDLRDKSAIPHLVAAMADEDMDVADVASLGLAAMWRHCTNQVIAAMKPKDPKSAFLSWRILHCSTQAKMREDLAKQILSMRGRNTPLGHSLGGKLITVIDTSGILSLMRKASASRTIDPGVAPFLALKLAENASFKLMAARALRNVKDRYALFPLVMCLGDKESLVVDEALQILAKQEKSGQLMELLRAAGKGRNQQRKIFASGILAKLGEGEAADQLLTALRDTTLSGAVRGVAAKILADLGEKRALEALEIYINEEKIDPLEKLGYLVAAARLGREGGFTEVVEILKGSRDINARLSAARVLADVKDESVQGALGHCFANPKEKEDFRIECMKSIVKTQGPKAVPILTPELGKLSGKIMHNVINALADIGAPARTPVITVLKQGSAQAKAQAIQVLAKLGDKTSLTALVAILKEPKSGIAIRKQAQGGLAMATGERYGGNTMMWEHHIDPKARLDSRNMTMTRMRPGGRGRCASISVPQVWSSGGTRFVGVKWPGKPTAVLESGYGNQRRYNGSSQKMINEIKQVITMDRLSGKPYKHIKIKANSFSKRVGRWSLTGFIFEDSKTKTTKLIGTCVIPATKYEGWIKVQVYCASEEWDYYWPLFQKIYGSMRFESPG